MAELEPWIALVNDSRQSWEGCRWCEFRRPNHHPSCIVLALEQATRERDELRAALESAAGVLLDGVPIVKRVEDDHWDEPNVWADCIVWIGRAESVAEKLDALTSPTPQAEP
jgi:hypothetical protein